MKKLISTIVILFCVISTYSQVLAPNGIRVGKKTSSKVGIIDSIPTYGTKIKFYRGGTLLSPVTADSLKATDYLVFKPDSNYQKPGSYTTRYDFKTEPTSMDLYKIYRKLGTTIKPIFTLCPQIAPTTVTPVDNRMCITLMYTSDTLTATGVKFSMNTAGAYTADQTNGFAFFRISNDTAYKVAETANVGTLWTAAAYTPTNIAFGTPVTIYPGFYAIGYIYNQAGQTTQPTFGGCQSPTLSIGQGLANGWYASMNWNTQNSFASFYKSSTYYSTNIVIPIFNIY